VAITDTNPSLRQSCDDARGDATSTPVARPRPVLAELWARLLTAPAAAVDKPAGRHRVERNRDGQWPAATLINTDRSMS
jgi:hypothetical protein